MDQEWMTGGYQNDLIYSLCPVSRATILCLLLSCYCPHFPHSALTAIFMSDHFDKKGSCRLQCCRRGRERGAHFLSNVIIESKVNKAVFI